MGYDPAVSTGDRNPPHGPDPNAGTPSKPKPQENRNHDANLLKINIHVIVLLVCQRRFQFL